MNIIMGAELSAIVQAGAQAIAGNMVAIQGGTFQMGATDLGNDERPVHTVTVSPFSISKYQATIGDHRLLLDRLGDHRHVLLAGSSGRSPKLLALGKNADAFQNVSATDLLGSPTIGHLLESGGQSVFPGLRVVELATPELASEFNHPRKPMIVQSFFEQVASALLVGGRLATEAEWEFAASVGGRFKYGTASGDELRKDEANFDSDATTKVGSYPPNGLGLFDMSGNVWERVMDWHGPYSAEAAVDPRGPETGDLRVFRGGSWIGNYPDLLRASYRDPHDPEDRSFNIGFRVASSLSASPQHSL